MAEVLCWCCGYFSLWDDKSKIGICELSNLPKDAYSTVCEDFFIRSGLHTKRTIPNYCKNKNTTQPTESKPLTDILKSFDYKKISLK